MVEEIAVATYQSLDNQLELFSTAMPFSAALNMKLERITHLLELLGNPHRSFPSIHVGGTSGKGSTSTIIASILTSSGFKTGLHVSPHIQVINEGYQINNKLVGSSKLLEILLTIRPAIEQVASESPFGRPSIFEIQIALAFCLFKNEQVDVAIVEVGLGGTLDATNVLEADVAVITNIGLDHTEILGDTIELIAKEKSGIIKQNQIVISGITQPTTRKIIIDRCIEQHATLWELGSKFILKHDESDKFFSIIFPDRTYSNLTVGMNGAFQAQNAACAIAAARGFTSQVSEKDIREGLLKTSLPGRMEVVQQNPTVILDGAHNFDKIHAAIQFINKHYVDNKRILVFALKEDKAYHDFLPYLIEEVDYVILTTFNSRMWKSYAPETLAEAMLELNPKLDLKLIPNPTNAVREALAIGLADDLIWVTGSLYLVGNIREVWYPSKNLIVQAEMNL